MLINSTIIFMCGVVAPMIYDSGKPYLAIVWVLVGAIQACIIYRRTKDIKDREK